MKKMPAFLAVPLLLISLSGCSTKPVCPTPHFAVDTDASVQCDHAEYQCHIQYVDQNTASLTFTAPESLAGFSVIRGSGNYSFSLGSLLCKGMCLLPENSPAVRVFSAFDTLSKAELLCTGQNEDNTFTFVPDQHTDSPVLTCDGSGHLLSLKTEGTEIRFALPKSTE